MESKFYEFEGFRFEAEKNTLWRDDEMISLPPKALELLCLLVKAEGELVTKNEILNTIWADTFVEEGVLTQNIYTLRQTLGTDKKNKQIIENIARRGYRLAVPVKKINQNESGLLNENNLHIFNESGQRNFESGQNLPGSHIEKSKSEPMKSNRRSVQGSPFLITAVILIILIAGFGIYYFLLRGTAINDAKISPIEILNFQRLTDTGDVIYPAISPNGEFLAFVRHAENQESVWTKQITGGIARQILPPTRNGYASLVFSPDGNNLYYRENAQGGEIFQMSVSGGISKKVAFNVWSSFGVSPDGNMFVFLRRDTKRNAYLLILTDSKTGIERELGIQKSPFDFRGIPAFSPDGSKVIAATGEKQKYFVKFFVFDLNTGERTEFKTVDWRAVSQILWMPDGKHIIASGRKVNESSSQVWMLSYPDGEISRLTKDLESYFWLSLSKDGKILVTRQQRLSTNLWLQTGDNFQEGRQLISSERSFDGYGGIAWSSQDTIVFSSFNGKTTDLFSIKSDGGERIQLTSNAGLDNVNPSVSKDGNIIVFSSNRTGTEQVWRMDADGRNQQQITFLKVSGESATSPVLSPDGRAVFFIKRGARPAAIWKVSIEGGNAVPVSNLENAATEDFLAISPDGKWLAYQHLDNKTDIEKNTRIGVLPSDGIGEPKLFDLNMRRPIVQWSADSDGFYYSSGIFNTSTLWRQTLDGNKPQKIADFSDRIYNFAFSPDFKKLSVSRGRQFGDAILITNLPK